MSQPRNPVSIKWVLIGAAIIIGLNRVLYEALKDFAYTPLIESMGPIGALAVFTVIVSLGSFFVGGLIIGWASPGVTLKEPAMAATIAVAVNLVIATATEGAFPNVIGAAIMIGLAYALGLAGAKLGERIQGETTEKMRERGELGRD